MTVVAVILLPVVLAYQAWTYHVFRARVRPEDFAPAVPAAAEPS
jgi:cytochrome d ubiquinol oxidase subunit II